MGISEPFEYIIEYIVTGLDNLPVHGEYLSPVNLSGMKFDTILV